MKAGFHEVVYSEDAKEVMGERGGVPWRVSSTLFSHVRRDVVL